MIYIKQNIFSADRQNVKYLFSSCKLFIFIEQTGKAITATCYDHFTGSQLSYNDFSNIYEKLLSRPYNCLVIDKSKNRFDCGKLRINSDWRVL